MISADAAETSRPAEGQGAALAMLFLGAAIIGLAPILVRLSDAGPAATGFWRLAFAVPLLAVMSLRAPQGDRFLRPPRAALAAGVFFTLDLAFWHYGIAHTTVANATVLTNLTPLVVMLFAWIAFAERPRAAFAAAVLMAIAGAALMAFAKGGDGRQSLLGDALSLTTALWYAFYFLAITVARRTSTASRVMFWSGMVGMPLLLLAALAMGEEILPLTRGGWLACIGLGLMHVGGQGAIAWSLGRLPTATASVTVLVQPVVAAILGWLLFKEALGPWQALGGAVTLGGVVLAQIAGARRKAQA